VQAFLYSIWGKLVLFGCTGALFFHTAAGVRHLLWDAGYGFSIEATDRSGYAVIGFTVLATLLVWGIGLEILP
jgi:succinate dehydrogenase / fumarate reductase cytochrome b subunit